MNDASHRQNTEALLKKLSAGHPLSAPGLYQRGFISAAEAVYPANEFEKILQERFFIPDDSAFRLDAFVQSAAELSVQNDLKRYSFAQGFEIEKNVNPQNKKNVEAYYEIDGKRVAVEVKCPEEKKPNPNSFVVASVGRPADFFEKADILHEIFSNSPFGHKLETAKNRDNSMKDFLLSANAKFCPTSGADDLNILFVGCGDIADVMEWWHTLYGSNEPFTAEPHVPTEQFKMVDVVALSNLRYLHTVARQYHDWTLDNAFILPCINPHKRETLRLDSVGIGLSVFNHHYFRFREYRPSSPLENFVLKVGTYCLYQLDERERRRYFPVQPPAKDRPEIPGLALGR
jgi:hypothetical protein